MVTFSQVFWADDTVQTQPDWAKAAAAAGLVLLQSILHTAFLSPVYQYVMNFFWGVESFNAD